MSARGLAPAAAAIAVAALALCGCRGGTDARGVVLITIDTVRADHLGCYGYEQGATPALDALAGEGVRFAQAQSPVPVTLPAHASMFTGQYPPVHGIRYNGMFRLRDESVTIAERLRDAGWVTGAVPSSFPVTAETGIGQGFETYQDLFAGPGADKLPMATERKAAAVVQLGIDWLGQRKPEERFLLWLHIWDAHWPYAPPFPYSVSFRERPYDGEIAYLDSELGKLFAALKQKGLWDDVLIVVAGDHGEALFEHREPYHATLAYQSTLHVPLLLKPPGGAAARVVDEPVSLVDLAPTILDYGGLPVPADVAGISLRPAASGAELPRRSLYHEALAGSLNYGWSPLEGVRRGRLKYTRSIKPELYDLDADPAESVNLYQTDRAAADDLDGLLAADLARWTAHGAGAEAAAMPLDDEAVQRLASLGYVGGSVIAERKGGPHPPDLVQVESSVLLARDQLAQGDAAGALGTARTILQPDPGNRFALYQAAVAARQLEQLPLSRTYAEELLRRYPEYQPATILLGELWVEEGHPAEAVEVFRAGLALSPGEDALTYRLALALLLAGQAREADAEVSRAIAGGATQPSFLLVRAVCRAALGDRGPALEALAEAIRRGYRDREVLEHEPLLAPLRALDGFEAAVAKVAEGSGA